MTGQCVKCGKLFRRMLFLQPTPHRRIKSKEKGKLFFSIDKFKTCPECRANLMNKSQENKYSIRLRHCKKCGRLFQINPIICFGQVKFETWQTCDKCRNKMTNEILTEMLAKARGLKI